MRWLFFFILSNLVPGKIGWWAARRWHRLNEETGNSWNDIRRRWRHRKDRDETQRTTTGARRSSR